MSTCFIARVCNVRKHPNADRLMLGTVLSDQVIVDLNTQEGDLGVYFPANLQLSDDFCLANNLYPTFDETGKRTGGGFISPKKRNIRAQNFRGEKSYGLFMPLESLSFIKYDLSKLKEGDAFSDLGGVNICQKYINEATRNSGGPNRNKKANRKETPTFPRHFDTQQFRYYIDRIKQGAKIILTLKGHGSSQRFGLCYEPIEYNWFQRLVKKVANYVGIFTSDGYWTVLNGTRNVILEKSNQKGYYGTDEFRYNVSNKITPHLRKGEVIYGEIVGWVNETTPIMPSVDCTIMGKEFVKKWGETMTYKYSCPPGTQGFYVYRICQFDEDGHAHELPWENVKKRCNELGIKHVIELEQFTYDGDMEKLKAKVEAWVDGEDFIDPSHIREGVCIRVEHEGEMTIYKQKSHAFLVLEGVAKDNEQVDIEEAS
jgi:hypothetical protein